MKSVRLKLPDELLRSGSIFSLAIFVTTSEADGVAVLNFVLRNGETAGITLEGKRSFGDEMVGRPGLSFVALASLRTADSAALEFCVFVRLFSIFECSIFEPKALVGRPGLEPGIRRL